MTGQEFVKKIGPVGCVIFLLITVGFLIICFKPATHSVEGYEAPHDSDYYAQHIDELKTELEGNFIPLVEGVTGCALEGSQVRLSIQEENFPDVVNGITYYYDKELFIFEKVTK